MAKRTNDLTEFAQPVADELAARCGSLKKVLSAGIMALNDMSPEKREYYMSLASGKKAEPPLDDISKLKEHIRKIAKKTGVKI